LKIGSAKFHIKRAISEMGRAKFREILISGAQFANFPVCRAAGRPARMQSSHACMAGECNLKPGNISTLILS
jgi:hypothetical protein